MTTADVTSMALEVRGISKSFGPTRALAGVDFAVQPGQIHALLGGNGSGKSTLIKVLAGVHDADSGTIAVGEAAPMGAAEYNAARARELGLRFVHQQESTFPDLSVAENLFLGGSFQTRFGKRISWSEVYRRSVQLLERLHLDVDPRRPVGELSPATQTLIAIARALKDDGPGADTTRTLVLDEPTASLPATEVNLLLSMLRRYAEAGQAIVFVSHRLDEVLHVADAVTVLRDGKLVGSALRKDLDHETLVEMILGRRVDRFVARTPFSGGEDTVLEVTGLKARAVRGVDLTVRRGEIVGIAGLLGSGRTSLLKTIFGLVPVECGDIRIMTRSGGFASAQAAMRCGVAMVPEDRAREAAFPDLSITDNLGVTTIRRFFKGGRLRLREERRVAKILVADHLVKAAALEDPLSTLSGGNQQKVILARWLRREPSLLLLDEPSQGVDVGARFELWQLIRAATSRGMGVLVASSDFEELAGVCDRVLIMHRGRIVHALTDEALTDRNIERLTLETQ